MKTTYEIEIGGSWLSDGVEADVKYPCGEVAASWKCDTIIDAGKVVNEWVIDNPFQGHKGCTSEYCTKLDKFELFALNHYLEEWPHDKDFKEITEGLKDGTLRDYWIKWPYREDDYLSQNEMRENAAERIIDMVEQLHEVFE